MEGACNQARAHKRKHQELCVPASCMLKVTRCIHCKAADQAGASSRSLRQPGESVLWHQHAWASQTQHSTTQCESSRRSTMILPLASWLLWQADPPRSRAEESPVCPAYSATDNMQIKPSVKTMHVGTAPAGSLSFPSMNAALAEVRH